MFPYKPSILGDPHLWKPPNEEHMEAKWNAEYGTQDGQLERQKLRGDLRWFSEMGVPKMDGFFRGKSQWDGGIPILGNRHLVE